MPYACPVCDTVEADAEHLANHLAVTASLHEDDHAAWLDDHVPDWPDRSPGELGAAVLDHAEERAVEGSTHSHDHREAPNRPPEADSGWPDDSGLDAETERVLQEAHDLTRRMGDDQRAAGDQRVADDTRSEDDPEE